MPMLTSKIPLEVAKVARCLRMTELQDDFTLGLKGTVALSRAGPPFGVAGHLGFQRVAS